MERIFFTTYKCAPFKTKCFEEKMFMNFKATNIPQGSADIKISHKSKKQEYFMMPLGPRNIAVSKFYFYLI